MEIGKYYADGEGFYRAIEKETHGKNNVVIMETVMTKDHSVSHYNNISFIEEACDKRMVECTKEQFEIAKEKALAIIDELYQFNSDVFLPLWKKKNRAMSINENRERIHSLRSHPAQAGE